MVPPASTEGGELNCAGKRLDLGRPAVMGVLNVTPDSFSDGGLFLQAQAALSRARRMVAAGADLIDVGGESTRPGARPVSVPEEIDRVVPLVEALAGELPVPVSVDTSKPEVMAASLQAGAGLINDVKALRAPGALEVLARHDDVAVCLMHMQGTPADMQRAPRYEDVVSEVEAFLAARVAACEAAGIARRRLIVDPGFGFGKTLAHNLRLLKQLERLGSLGLPILAGLSRKSMIGALLDAPVDKRLHGSVAAAVIAVLHGARIVRVHDVEATVQALKICQAVTTAGPCQGGGAVVE